MTAVTDRATLAAPAAAPSPRERPVDVPATTEELLRERHDLPLDDLGRAELRTRVIQQNLPLANRLARRYAGRGELFDDLAQVAALALVKSIDGYDPDRLTPFASYAVPSIVGALKRHFRDTAWAMRVPRSTQDLAREAAGAAGRLSQDRGRSPTAADLAAHLGVHRDDVLAALGAAHAYRLVSLDAPSSGADNPGGGDLVDLVGDIDPQYTRVDDRMVLRPLLATLSPRDRQILAMRYYRELSQSQIAAEIGVSQMHVSRLLTRILAQLRAGVSH